MKSKHYVYLLRCSDNTIYTGYSTRLEERIEEHKKGEVNYTKTRLPVQLETYLVFFDKYQAFKFEKYLKSGSGKAFSNKRLLNPDMN